MKKFTLLLFLGPLLLILLLLLGRFLFGGSPDSADKELAEQAVADFHDAYNRRDFSEIYKGTGLDYRHLMTETAMQAVLENAHLKLGKEITYSETSIQVSTFKKVSHITIIVQAQFSDGMAPEKFNYTVYSGKALLDGYHIDVQH